MTGHIPVLLTEMKEALALKDQGIYVDATFGGGGYTRALLENSTVRVFGLDRDPDAAVRAQALETTYPDRFCFLQGTFFSLPQLLSQQGIPKIDGIVFDYGVSSFQLDEADRGFSFRFDGPLDMRMSKEGISAADVVNTFPEKELADIIYQYGEERKSRSIAKAICIARNVKKFETTLELATLVKSTIGGRPDAQHPATLTFQALRIFVNNELIEIEAGLSFAEAFLKPGGRLVTVSFHSLEDHLVKTFIRARRTQSKKPSRLLPGEQPPAVATFRDLSPRGIAPSPTELEQNSRSRSARLRVAERLGEEGVNEQAGRIIGRENSHA